MLQQEIENQLKSDFPNATMVDVALQDNYAQITIEDKVFETLSKVKSQQLVYKSITKWLQDNSIHAVNISTKTSS